MILGKYENGGATSYIARAGTDFSYFDLGNDLNNIMETYGLSYKEMFNYFNKPALDDAISSGKTIRFFHDPQLFETGFIVDEWTHIKLALKLTDADLIFEGGK